MKRVTVLGAGGWGTALAVHLRRVGHQVRLWARDPELAVDLATRRANPVYLPDVTLPAGVIFVRSDPPEIKLHLDKASPAPKQ